MAVYMVQAAGTHHGVIENASTHGDIVYGGHQVMPVIKNSVYDKRFEKHKTHVL